MLFYEASLKGAVSNKNTGESLVSKINIRCALTAELAAELGNAELYRPNGTLTEFTSHGFTYEIDTAEISFLPMPGTCVEDDVLLHLPSCSVGSFWASRLTGGGAALDFTITTNGMAPAITNFQNDVRGWSGRLEILPLQDELFTEGEGEAPAGRPKPSKKRGRGAQPQPVDQSQATLIPEAEEVSPIPQRAKSGQKQLKTKKPASGKKRSGPRVPPVR